MSIRVLNLNVFRVLILKLLIDPLRPYPILVWPSCLFLSLNYPTFYLFFSNKNQIWSNYLLITLVAHSNLQIVFCYVGTLEGQSTP